MKTRILLIFIVIPQFIFSQLNTSPNIPTINKEITLIFDASETSLAGYTGKVYAHTGVTVDNEKWQNVIGAWGNNTLQPEFTRDSENANLYTLKITPDIYSFYGVDKSKTISELSIVIRSSDGNLKNGPDLFIDIFDNTLNIAITSPTDQSTFDQNQTITLTAESTTTADLQILVDDISIETIPNATTISTSYFFANTGNHTIKAIASNGNEIKETSISVFVKTTTQNMPRPNNEKSGITIQNNEVTFVLLAPEKSDVILLGDFNDWKTDEDYLMHKDGEYFWITLSDLNPSTEYAYQFLIDYEIKIADPYSEKILTPTDDSYITNDTYPNLKSYPTDATSGNVSTFTINESNYSWKATNFNRPEQSELVIYEMLIRDFTKKSTYKEALLHLDYLESLGVNAIELMPVNEFEGNDSWGYNPSFYMALDKAYGTKNDFKNFIDACHSRGIAVLEDVVFNHSFSQSPLLHMYWNSATNKPAANSPWYNENHNLVDNTAAHWGYDFDHTSSYTKDFFKDVLDYWMEEYKVDGFRFDFTKGFSNTIYEGENNWASEYDAERIAILKEYTDHVWDFAPYDKPYVIFEHLAENSEEKELADYGILLWGNLNHSYTENTMGYGDNIDWISYQKRSWNTPTVLGYMESHDEERMMYKNLEYGKEDENYSVKNLNTALERQELAGAFLFTIPGPKMIWQFGELGYEISIDQNGRTGKKPVLWEYLDNANRKHIYNTWSTLIALKNKHDVFKTEDFSLNTSKLQKSITLRDASMDVIIVGNFDIVDETMAINFTKTGTWFEYFDGEELSISKTQQSVHLEPGEYRIYTSEKIYDPRGGTENDDSDNDGVNDLEDLCPNTIAGATVDEKGCALFTLDKANFSVKSTSETCQGESNGTLSINSIRNSKFSLHLNEQIYDFRTSLNIEDLSPGTYEFCIYTEEDVAFEQCYEFTIDAATTISAKTTNKIEGQHIITNINITEGKAPYTVYINNTKAKETNDHNFNIETQMGDAISVGTAADCEGKFEELITLQTKVTAYPNPVKDNLILSFENNISSLIRVSILDTTGKTIDQKEEHIINGSLFIDISQLENGFYFIRTEGVSTNTINILKQ